MANSNWEQKWKVPMGPQLRTKIDEGLAELVEGEDAIAYGRIPSGLVNGVNFIVTPDNAQISSVTSYYNIIMVDVNSGSTEEGTFCFKDGSIIPADDGVVASIPLRQLKNEKLTKVLLEKKIEKYNDIINKWQKEGEADIEREYQEKIKAAAKERDKQFEQGRSGIERLSQDLQVLQNAYPKGPETKPSAKNGKGITR